MAFMASRNNFTSEGQDYRRKAMMLSCPSLQLYSIQDGLTSRREL